MRTVLVPRGSFWVMGVVVIVPFCDWTGSRRRDVEAEEMEQSVNFGLSLVPGEHAGDDAVFDGKLIDGHDTHGCHFADCILTRSFVVSSLPPESTRQYEGVALSDAVALGSLSPPRTPRLWQRGLRH
jgi:hypothetical protein